MYVYHLSQFSLSQNWRTHIFPKKSGAPIFDFKRPKSSTKQIMPLSYLSALGHVVSNPVHLNYIRTIKSIPNCFGPIIEIKFNENSPNFIIWIASDKVAYNTIYEIGNSDQFLSNHGVKRMVILNKSVSSSWTHFSLEQFVQNFRSDSLPEEALCTYFCFHSEDFDEVKHPKQKQNPFDKVTVFPIKCNTSFNNLMEKILIFYRKISLLLLRP